MDKELFMFYKAALEGELTTPLCSEYKSAWRKCGDDKEQLVRLVMRQQALPYFVHYCYNGKGVTKEYIMDAFGNYINGKYYGLNVDGVDGDYKTEIYVGDKGILSPSANVLCAMWCNSLTFEIRPAKSPFLYIACNSDVHISCLGYNSPRIYLFDESKVTLDDVDMESSVTVFKYSDGCVVEKGDFCISENIKEYRKELRL